MSRLVQTWSSRWFGFWSEFGPAYAQCPSVMDFVVEKSITAKNARLLNYLSSAPIVASSSRRSFSNSLIKQQKLGSVSVRSDGHLLWLDSVVDDIAELNVELPYLWASEIERKGFTVPAELSEGVIETLDWPPIR
jgi:hypothetical protein